jgi:hypothetical protein
MFGRLGRPQKLQRVTETQERAVLRKYFLFLLSTSPKTPCLPNTVTPSTRRIVVAGPSAEKINIRISLFSALVRLRVARVPLAAGAALNHS